MSEIKTIEQVIGENMRRLRGEQSQSHFGKRIGGALGKTWSAQVVSAAEAGKRSFIAAEMVALCLVGPCTMKDLYRVTPETAVRVTGKVMIPGYMLNTIAAGVDDQTVTSFLWDMLPKLQLMQSMLKDSSQGIGKVTDELAKLMADWALTNEPEYKLILNTTKTLEDFANGVSQDSYDEPALSDPDPDSSVG